MHTVNCSCFFPHLEFFISRHQCANAFSGLQNAHVNYSIHPHAECVIMITKQIELNVIKY